jgi:hypothetical protein
LQATILAGKLMITSLLSLVITLHASLGVYALLLGSGIFRPAGMPTGWEIVLDLITKLSKIEGDDIGADPCAWYKSKYGTEPTYSGLLEAVAKSQAERAGLLAGHFEPTEREREQGLKIPTKAHHAIARLVKSGHIEEVKTILRSCGEAANH